MSVLAIIPARAGSKGIPNKNFRALDDGWSPTHRAVTCAWEADIAHVVITTDHTTFQGVISPERVTTLVRRPAELAQDDTPMIAVVRHVLDQIQGPDDQIIVLLQPTQPLREPKHVTAAIELLRSSGADSVVSVVGVPLLYGRECQAWMTSDGGLIHDWTDGDMPQRRQDLGRYYVRDGSVYAFTRRTVARYGNIYGADCRALILPAEESCPLDTPEDWAEAERRLRERGL